MDILLGPNAVGEFQASVSEAMKREQAEWTAEEFRQQTRLNAHQSAFAQQFSTFAPSAWQDLVFIKPLAIEALGREFAAARSTPTPRELMKIGDDRRLLSAAVSAWCEKYQLVASWVHFVALVTVRAFALHAAFSYESPATLLHNTFPTLTLKDGDVELGRSTMHFEPSSSAIVCGDLGPQEWNTLEESRAHFRKRMIDSFTKNLDEQLALVTEPLLAEDLEVHWHHINLTVARYGGVRSIRSLAQEFNMTRPGVSKAIERTRLELGLEKLPETWGATPVEKWKLHET